MIKNGELMDQKQFLHIIKKELQGSKLSMTKFAAQKGKVSFQFLSHVLKGDYNPGPKLAHALGYEQVYAFRRLPLRRKKAKKKAAHEPNKKQQAAK
jgi:hypothetical protein